MPIMTTSRSNKLLGVVVPTLGTRVEYLSQCLHSLQSDQVYVVIVGPESLKALLHKRSLGYNEFLIELTSDSLATSINKAMARIPEDIPFITWIGDDDILNLENSLEVLSKYKNLNDVVVYGDCDYIDTSAHVLWKNHPGEFAASFISLLPQRIAQPASFIRHSAWKEIGGLNPRYKLAFDYDMFIRLSAVGKLSYSRITFASYRWHQDALSVKARKFSVIEAFKVRQSTRSGLFKILYIPLEITVMTATYLFGLWMKYRLMKSR